MKITTTCEVAKGLNIKREKGEDEIERVIAHLKVADLFVTREQINELCGQGPGWSETALFDDQGAALALLDIGLPNAEFPVTGDLHQANGTARLKIGLGTLSGLSFLTTTQGASLSATLSWEIAGDEASEIEPLLGRNVVVALDLQAPRQRDLLKDRVA